MNKLGSIALIFIIGVVLFGSHRLQTCPPAKVIYRYLPRDLDMQMRDAQIDADFLFEKDSTDVWTGRSKI